jgi:hypothetical protein
MTTYVFDTSGFVRFVRREAGAQRVEAVNWGELQYTLIRRIGLENAGHLSRLLLSANLAVLSATTERAERAAIIKTRFKMGYADCFGVELAMDSRDHILVTADFGAKPAENDIRIEFLPTKPTP